MVLCLAMMLSIMVVGAGSAFAEQCDIDTKHQHAVDMCNTLNIITGFENGKFMPKDNVTREQMAKMICVLDNGGKEPQLATGSTFTDVPADRWSNKYIEACASRSVVVGVGNNKFSPAGKVTATQAAKMLLVELGYDDDLQQYSGADWATKVNVDATKKGYYEDLEDIDVSAPLTREHAAQMIWNALQAKEIEYDYTLIGQDGNLSSNVKPVDKDLTLMADKYGLNDEHHGIMTGFTYNDTKGEWTYYLSETVTAGRDTVKEPVSYKSSTDYTDLFQQDVTVVYKEKSNKAVDSVYGMFADKDNSQVLAQGIIGDISNTAAGDKTVKIDGTLYDAVGKNAKNVNMFYFQNGNENVPSFGVLTDWVKSGNYALAPFEFTAIDLNSDDTIDSIVVYPYAVGQVNLLNSSTIGVKYLRDKYAATPLVTNAVANDELKDVDVYDGVAKDDYVIYTPNTFTATNKTTIEKAENVVAGTASRVTSDGKIGSKVTVDGTQYTNISKEEIAAGSTLKDGIVVNGYLFLVESTGAVSVDDYAVVVAYADGGNSVNGAQVKLLMADGTKKVVDLKKVYQENGKDEVDNLKDTLDAKPLVTFSKNSSDEYSLTLAVTQEANKDKSGFDSITAINYKFDKTTEDGAKDFDGTKVKYIKNTNIADDAVVFVNDSDGQKVITGAQLKKTAAAGITVKNAYADSDSKTNFNTVQLAYVTKTGEAIKSGETLYGYLLADVASVENKDGDKVNELTIWDGKTEITLNGTDLTTATGKGLKEGAFISYTVNSDGDVDSAASVGTKAAIWSYDGTYVTFGSNGTRYKITSDTETFYINAKDVAGTTDGEIQIAQDKAIAAGQDAAKYNNCVWVDSDNDKELDVLFVDINNDLDDVIGK